MKPNLRQKKGFKSDFRKAEGGRDTSLRVPHGESGIAVDVKEFTRENGETVTWS